MIQYELFDTGKHRTNQIEKIGLQNFKISEEKRDRQDFYNVFQQKIGNSAVQVFIHDFYRGSSTYYINTIRAYFQLS